MKNKTNYNTFYLAGMMLVLLLNSSFINFNGLEEVLPDESHALSTNDNYSFTDSVNAGPDTLICGFTYDLVGLPAGGSWQMLCSESEGVVSFENSLSNITEVKVNQCGNYTFIYDITAGPCIGSDTIIVGFENPSSKKEVFNTEIELELLMDCPEPAPSCDNVVVISDLTPPVLFWEICGEKTCASAWLFMNEGPFIDSCVVENITCDTFNTMSSISGCLFGEDIDAEEFWMMYQQLDSILNVNCYS